MPKKKHAGYRLPENEAAMPLPVRLPIVDVMMGQNPKRGEPVIEVLGRPPADRTKERA